MKNAHAQDDDKSSRSQSKKTSRSNEAKRRIQGACVVQKF